MPDGTATLPSRYEVEAPDQHVVASILRLAKDTSCEMVLRFMAYTGVRQGEAIGLKWENLDLERGVASIVQTAQRITGQGTVFLPTKSAAGRRGVALAPETVEMLRVHRGRQILHQVELDGLYRDMGLLFPRPLGTPMDPSRLSVSFKKLARHAGYPNLRLHELRHAHAAGLIRAGANPSVVQSRLGHASAAFTMDVYGHVSADLQAEAANAFAKLMPE